MHMTQSLEQSCDVYYYEIAQRVGIDRISEMAQTHGLGVKFDLPMSAVSEGLAPDKDWKKKKYDKDWLIGDTLNAGIGQGYVLASPLQLAVLTARVATGREVMPRLVRAVDGQDPFPVPEAPSLGLGDASLRFVRQGMFDVVNSKKGTAQASRVLDKSVLMAGKTGTSQVRNITAAERAAGVISNDQLPWERRDHALFVCYAPFDAPRVAVAVVVEHGGGGSAVAAPIARDILMQALFEGFPPLEAYPESQRGKVEALRGEIKLIDPATVSGGGKSRA